KVAEGVAQQDAKIVALDGRMREGFAQLDAKMREGFAQQDAKMREGFAQQDARMREGFAKLDANTRESSARLDGRISAVGWVERVCWILVAAGLYALAHMVRWI
ncbi:MAG TPA: hypothetical protein VIL32_00045, partial [Steroidobacteraceae bacterium]